MALERKQTALAELEGLDEQIAGMEREQEKLTQAEQRLQAKVDAFRNKKEIIKAQYTAAQAQVRIGAALGGISEEMGDVSLAVQRAENKTDQMRAKAGAIDELVEAGVLGRHHRPPGRHRTRVGEDFDFQHCRSRTGRAEELQRCISLRRLNRLTDDLPRRTPPKGTGRLLTSFCHTGALNVIVRILGEGQFNLPGSAIDDLNDIDNRMVEAVAAEDGPQFQSLLDEMFQLVRDRGEPLPLDELVESDLILPETDLTLDEAEHIFIGDGLLPG